MGPEGVVQVWSSSGGYDPPELGLQVLYDNCSNVDKPWANFFNSVLHSILDRLPPTRHEARLSLYDAPSAFLTLPVYPSVAVTFRPSQPHVTLPSLKLSSTGTEEPRLYLSGNSLCSSDYRAGTVIPSQSVYVQFPRLPRCVEVTVTSLSSSLIHLFLDYTHMLTSANLEVIADCCPRLTRLSLFCCWSVLKKLKGMIAIAAHCPQLEDLSLGSIHFISVECIDSLWDILGRMHLIHLVVEAYMFRRQASEDVLVPTLYATTPAHSDLEVMTSLTAVEVNGAINDGSYCHCGACTHGNYNVAPISEWNSLEYLSLTCQSNTYLSGLVGCIDRLKYLYLRILHQANIWTNAPLSLHSVFFVCSNLEQLYLEYQGETLTEELVIALTSGGKITHAFFAKSHGVLTFELIFGCRRNRTFVVQLSPIHQLSQQLRSLMGC